MKSVGALIYSRETGRFLFGIRSKSGDYAQSVGTFGGKVEDGESDLSALNRELSEELGLGTAVTPSGYSFKGLLVSYKEDDFQYDTYGITVDKEFTPKLDAENYGYVWTTWDGLASLKLHPKMKATIFSNEAWNNIKKLTTL